MSVQPTANDRPNSVYRYYDHARRLIYVGITARGGLRQQEHNQTSEFWHHVDSEQVEHCHSRDEALRLERELIKAYRPPFNKVHNEGWEAIRAAYEAVLRAEAKLRSLMAGESPVAERCGHCASCVGRVFAPEEQWNECRTIRPQPDEEGTYCYVCGKTDCVFLDGFEDGRYSGWNDGYDAGKRRAHEDMKHFIEFIQGGGTWPPPKADDPWASPDPATEDVR